MTAPAGWQCDVLTRSLRIWQRRDGHKATSDDLLLAWLAAREAPAALRALDLGTGKGTVALLLTQLLPTVHVLGVEAFPESHALALRNIEENGVSDRFEARLGDLRDGDVLAGCGPFDLVTGAPPFMPLGSGVLPRDPQRAAGRFEVRGGVEAYVQTGAARLARSPSARLAILMDGAGGARAVRAFASQALAVHRVVAVAPRPDRQPTYRIVVGGWPDEGATASPAVQESLSMRDAVGDGWSAEYLAVRRALDLP